MPVRLKNNARGLLAVSVTALDTVIRVRVGQGNRFPLLGEDEWFPLILEDEQGNIEITRAISISGDAITVMRAQDGTQARAFPADTLVSLRLTPAAIRSWFNGEDPSDEEEGDPDYGGTGLIFNGLIVNAYHTEQGRQGYFHPNSGTSEGQFVFAGACYMAAEAIQDYIEDHQPVPEGMTVTGTLPDYVAGEAYEGRLQINNSIGVCTVQQIAGDALPPGSRIRVDNYRKEVVIDWPAYAELPGDPLPNGDFEKGDQDWIKGPGWSIEPTGNANDGHGARVAVYRGSGESVLESEAFTPCEPGLRFPVKVNVQQGASAAGNAGAGIGMRYYSAQDAGSKVGEQFGNQIWSGAKGRWHWSNLDAVVPDGANFMRAVIVGGRKRENKPLWVDDASWSIPKIVGINVPDISFMLTIEVTDSSGQRSRWTGGIGEFDWEPALISPAMWFDDESAITMGENYPDRVDAWQSRSQPPFIAGGTSEQFMPTIPGDGPNGRRTLRFVSAGGGFYVIPDGVPSFNFARNVNSAWAFAVYKRNVVGAAGELVGQRCPWSVTVGGVYGTNRFSMAIESSGKISVSSLRNDASTALEKIESLTSPPVGEWVAAFVCCDYISRTAKVFINGAVSTSESGLWDASGPTSDTESPDTNVGGVYLKPDAGPSGGGRSNYLNNVDVACVIAGSGSSPPTNADIANLFMWASLRYGIPVS